MCRCFREVYLFIYFFFTLKLLTEKTRIKLPDFTFWVTADGEERLGRDSSASRGPRSCTSISFQYLSSVLPEHVDGRSPKNLCFPSDPSDAGAGSWKAHPRRKKIRNGQTD